jgi:hypothetical protein
LFVGSGGNCSIVELHPRQPRPFGTAVRFVSGVLREQCSLVTILASQRAGTVCFTPSAPEFIVKLSLNTFDLTFVGINLFTEGY